MNFLKANKDNLNEIMLLYKEVIKTTFTTWGEDYPSRELIKSDIDDGNIYIVIEDNKIIAVSFLGVNEEENEEWVNKLNNPLGIARICVKKEYQGKGIGSKIIHALEQDEYFLRAKRIEIPASITAVEFYRKMGYDYKNGIAELDDEQIYRLEKFR